MSTNSQPPQPAQGASPIPDLDGWEHVSGPVRKKPLSIYRQRSEEPPGWFVSVGTTLTFVHDAPHQLIAAVLAEVAQLVHASAAAKPARPTPPRPPVPGGSGAPTPARVSPAQTTFPGETAWPGDVTTVSMPAFLHDEEMKEAFGKGIIQRLNRMPPQISGWAKISRIIGPSPPHRPGLWELFPGSGNPEVQAAAMKTAAENLYTEMGYTVENGHVYVGKPGERSR